MRSWIQYILLFVLLLSSVDLVAAKINGYFTLINGTPYDWSLTDKKNHRMGGMKLPDTIPAGTTSENYFRLSHDNSNGEFTYTLLGVENPQSFTISARFKPKKHPQLQVKFHDTLSSLNNPPESSFYLPWYKGHATVFLLAGSGTTFPYISSNPPVGWMQATLDNIGDKTLNQISMPLSHDAGMSKLTKLMGGADHNTKTQTKNIYGQLVNGARSFDIRPLLTAHGRWLTGHTTKIGCCENGGAGEHITDIVKDINKFTNEYPGELIILDLTHDIDLHGNSHPFKDETWHQLYQILSKIDDLWIPPFKNGEIVYDLSRAPLTTFIRKGGRSAVLIKIRGGAPLPDPALNIIPDDPVLAVLGPVIEMSKFLFPNFDYQYDPTIQPGVSDKDSSMNVEDDHAIEANEGSQDVDGSGDAEEKDLEDSEGNDTTPSATNTIRRLFRRNPGPKNNPKSQDVNKFSTAAFIAADSLREFGSYSDTKHQNKMWPDQVQKLDDYRGGPNGRDRDIFRMTWTLTQDFAQVINVGIWGDSIIENGHRAKDMLYLHLWDACSKTTYPNLIEVDDVRDLGPLTIAMGINEVFARDDD